MSPRYEMMKLTVIFLSMFPMLGMPAVVENIHQTNSDISVRANDVTAPAFDTILPRQGAPKQQPMSCNAKCTGRQAWDKVAKKCSDCPKGKVPNTSHKKCIDCPSGQKPNALGDRCEKGDSNNKEKKEENYQKKKEEETKKYKENKGKQNKEKKEQNFQKKKKEETEKYKKTKGGGDDKKKKNMRKNLCLTMFVGAGFLTAEEFTAEAMNGFAEAFEWPADITGMGKEITESNIELTPVEPSERRLMRLMRRKGGKGKGGGDWRNKLWKVILDKIFPKDRNGKTVMVNTSKLNRNIKEDRPPRKEDVDAAKNSPGLKKVKDDSNYGLCLAGAALTFTTAYYEVALKPDAPAGDEQATKAQPDEVADQLKVCLWDDEDDTSDEGSYCWQSYADSMARKDRMPWESCKNAHDENVITWDSVEDKPKYADNRATAMKVENGCCAFYDQDNCGGFLFAATNRQDGELTDGGNDSISSMWCTANADCAGKP